MQVAGVQAPAPAAETEAAPAPPAEDPYGIPSDYALQDGDLTFDELAGATGVAPSPYLLAT